MANRQESVMAELEREAEEMEKALGKRTEEPKEEPKEPTKTVEAELEDEPDEEPINTEGAEVEDEPEESEDEDTLEDGEDDDPATEEEELTTDPKKKKKREDWKKRFTRYKAATDSTIHQLRTDLANEITKSTSFQKRMQTMTTRLEQLEASAGAKDALKLFTEEERDVLGDEAISTIQKATNALIKQQIEPLKEKLRMQTDNATKADESRAKQERIAAYQIFLNKLSNLVEGDLEKIDKDPKFKEFLEGMDPASGSPRLKLFRAAEANADVGRVAGFFNEFVNGSSARRKKLESKITPTGNTRDAAANVRGSIKPSGKVWTYSGIDAFTDDCVRGKYKGKEDLRAQIEAEIDAAIMSGRVRR